jgi:6-phosphogluconolactonase
MSRYIVPLFTLIFGLMIAAPAFTSADHGAGAVYTMTNAESGNEVVVYNRATDGSLAFEAAVPTGGNGKTIEPNDALGAQNPLILSPNHRFLFAVNAGSDTIAVFRVRDDGLKLVDVVASGGEVPVSLTLNWNLLYVLNAGGDGNITGFSVDYGGHLTPIPGSTRSLNTGGSNPLNFLESPAQVGFSPRGDKLVVTVKGVHPVHQIHVFGVDRNGLPSAQPVTTTSNTTLSFGFDFVGLNRLIVAEPFGNSLGPDGQGNDVPPPVPERGAASAYNIRRDGSLAPISTSVLNAQTATCWIATTAGRRFAYTTNNVSNTISSYKLGPRGGLTLIEAVAAESGDAPVDLAITPDSRYLYNVNAADGTVSTYEINRWDGSLAPLGAVGGLPANGSAVGIAAY